MCKWRMFRNFGFQVLDTGFFQSVKLGFWIFKTRIPHSTGKNLLLFGFPHKNSLDSGIRISLHGRLNIPPFGIFYKKKLFPFSLTSTLILSLFYCLMVRQKNCWKQHQTQQQIRKIKRRRRLIWHKNPEALQSMLRREGGGGGLKSRSGDASLLGKGSEGILPQNTLKYRGSEMVFSTFSINCFSKKIATWIRCKMTDTTSAYSVYLLLKQKHFSFRKLEWLPPPPPTTSPAPPSLHIFF